jgi:hypothetical protein
MVRRMVAQRSNSMSENRNDGNWYHQSVSGPLRVGAPDAIPKRDRLTDAQINQVRELLAQERVALAQAREALLTDIGEAVGKLLDRQVQRIENAMAARNIEIEALQQRTIAELRALVSSEEARVIDGVPVTRSRNMN